MENFIELTKIAPFDTVTLKGKVERYANSEEVASIKYENGLKVTILQISQGFVISCCYKETTTTRLEGTINKSIDFIKRKIENL